jgi:hypothetical protein
LISWAPVATAALVSTLLIVALFLVSPRRTHAAPRPVVVAAVVPEVARPQPPIPAPLPPPAPERVEPVALLSPPPRSVAEPIILPPRLPPPLEPPSPPKVQRPEPPPVKPKAAGCEVDHRYGTSVDFVDDPTDAAEQAQKDKKLLFVLHIAGNFEKDTFT